MGEYAADALAREMGISFSDAHEMLYGEERMSGSASRRCPICGKRSRSPKGVLAHAMAVHPKPAHQSRIDAWMAQAFPKGVTP